MTTLVWTLSMVDLVENVCHLGSRSVEPFRLFFNHVEDHQRKIVNEAKSQPTAIARLFLLKNFSHDTRARRAFQVGRLR